MASVPADPDALAGAPVGNPGTDSVNSPCDLMAGHDRIFQVRETACLGKHIAVADAACLDADAHLTRSRIRHGSFHQGEGAVRL